MKQFAKVLLLTLGFGVLAAVLGFLTNGRVGAQDPGPPGGLDVHVVNTPLPVTGTVGISGTPTVGISGTPNVHVTNATTSPVPVRDVENPAREAFLAHVNCTADAGLIECPIPAFFIVPANKRLVVETVSATVVLPAGQKASATITVHLGGTHTFRLPLTLQSLGTFDLWVFASPLRFYAPAGDDIDFAFVRSASTGTADLAVTVSGYLVDCGAGTGCPLP